MKSFLKVALGSLTVLLAAQVFTACSSDKEDIVENPNYNSETGEVNTQFVFTVSTGSESVTRQSSATVQDGDGFRGINGVKIMAYKNANGDGHHLYTATTADKVYDLATVLTQGQITSEQQNRVIELSLPLDINTLMFYGKAIKNGTAQEQGDIEYSVDGNLDNTYFRLKPRLTDPELFNETVTLLEKVLSRVVDCGLHNETTGESPRDFRYAFRWDSSTAKGEVLEGSERTAALAKLTDPDGATSYADPDNSSATIYAGTLDWKTLGQRYIDGVSQTPLEEILGSTFAAFTHINDGEVRAGSTASVLRAVNDVMITNDKVANAIPTSAAEYLAWLLADRLNTRFGTYFENDELGGVKFKRVSVVKSSLQQYISADPAQYARVTDDALSLFPTNLNLPMGAAQLNFDKTTGEFTYNSTKVLFGINNDSTNLSRLMWPAELCYFGNSPIRVSSSSKTSADYPALVGNWLNDNDIQWNDFTKNSRVHASTRAVAMQNDINYGTSLLETMIKVTSDVLQDNNSQFNTSEDNNKIDATSSVFALKGVLIGGQNNEMGWNYLRKYDDSENTPDGHYNSFNYVIYDNAIGNLEDGEYKGIEIPSAGATSAPNYTLVFDNYSSDLGNEEQSPVYVALELVNNTSRDFYGENGLVRSGGTFYIVGKLDPANATNKATITFPDGTEDNVHPLPPYDANGKTIPAKRVFIQDYKTTVTFMITDTSLQKALVTVPDLRATNISLGMAVDLKWTPGLNFEVNLGQ